MIRGTVLYTTDAFFAAKGIPAGTKTVVDSYDKLRRTLAVKTETDGTLVFTQAEADDYLSETCVATSTTQPREYTAADLNPITDIEKNMVMAVIAMCRGDALDCNGVPMKAGRTISVDKEYDKRYEPVVVPWGFIDDDVKMLSIETDGEVYVPSDTNGNGWVIFPIKLDLNGVKLPQDIYRPEV